MTSQSHPSAVAPSLARPRRTPFAGIIVLGAAAMLTSGFLLLGLFSLIGVAWAAGCGLLLYDAALLGYTVHRVRRAGVIEGEIRPPVKTARRSPSVTVILAAYNEAAILPEAIDRLRHQSDPPEAIIIADDGSTDATADLLAERFGLAAADIGVVSTASQPIASLRWLRLERGGKARAVNHAVALADTDLIIVLDADTLLDRHAIGAMRQAFARDPHLAAATGVMEPFTNGTFSGRVMRAFQAHEYRWTALMSLAWQQDRALQLIAGAFAGFRRDAFLSVGGFDPYSLVEDYDLAHRLHRHASDHGLPWTIAVVGKALCYTEAPATPLSLIRQRRRWFGGFLQIHWLNRDMIANRRFHRLGTRLMTVKTIDTIQPFVGLTAAASLGLGLESGAVIAPLLFVLFPRLLINLASTLWAHRAYSRWTGQPSRPIAPAALLAGAIEGWSYRLVRHVGEVWGWSVTVRREMAAARPISDAGRLLDRSRLSPSQAAARGRAEAASPSPATRKS